MTKDVELTGDALLAHRILAAADLFAGWPGEAVADLAREASVGRYARGRHLSPANPRVREIVFVGSGFIDVSLTTPRGREFLLGIFGPGHVLGILRLLPVEAAAYDYRAREDSVVVRLPSDRLLAVLDGDQALWASVARMALGQYRVAMHDVIGRRVGDISARVAGVMDHLATLHGEPDPRGIRLRVRVSQEDVAAMLSTTRQTVHKELHQLAEAGVIDVRYAAWIIRDLTALRRRMDYAW
ncbi:MAG: Crp/Fnr family transcriptional regulator [Proteobacteria bacterium]|nr:Crp/Fnr family transcriptional regulator [Pseudomonadota bacterium]